MQILKKYIPLLLLCFTSVAVHAQNASFDYLDVFDLQFVGSPQISPDGETIIYVRHQFDIMTDRRYTNLWQINFDGTGHKPLTSGKNSYGTPVWSPDGSKLAYTSTEEGSNQIFIHWLESGESASVTNVQQSPGNLQWSPDGTQLLFSMRIPADKPVFATIPSPPEGAEWAKPATVLNHVQYKADGQSGILDEGYTHLFVMSAEGGAARQLTHGNYNHNSARWAPEGETIIFTADYTGNADLDPNNAQIYEMNIESGEKTQLTDKRGPHNSPVISPDGETIAYTGYEDEFVGYQLTNIYLMNRDGSDLQVLSDELTTDPSNLNWSSDSESIFFQTSVEGETIVANINMDGEISTIATDLASTSIGRPYNSGSYSVAENGRFSFPMGSPVHPAELVVGHYPTRMANIQITSINDEFLKSRKFGLTQEFWVDSSIDDFRVHGWIITPPDFDPSEKYPLILEIHGGPYSSYGPSFTPELQLMASKGYVVVYTNPRGSTSYGEDFAAYINRNYPSEDYDDLMDAVDYVVDQGYVNEEQLFITGGSGGGVLTAWSIGKTDRFAAAVVAKPVINWYSFALTADSYPFFTKYWLPGMPWENPMAYHELSPISLVGNVTTPTMLLTGEDDYRTPMSESEQYYQALKLQGVDAAMVRIPDTSHGIVSRPSNLIRKVSYILGWFEEYSNE
jgi:dipeptidyl aminopeptidase/acylaminoacyl peptidase